MIKLTNTGFRYSARKELYKNLNLTLHAGKIYGLLGKNGAGKSTLLKMICGLLFPSSGRVEVNGHMPGKRQPSFLSTCCLIPEEVYVPPITVNKYINLYSVFYPLFDKAAMDKFLQILEVEPSGKLNTFSFGQQKKFVIAFALACNTRVLILDEPTNGLDIPSKMQFRKLIASVMNDDRIILISTHQVRDLENMIDHVVIVDNGTVLLDASIERIAEELNFDTVDSLPDTDIYYSETSLRGISIVTKNEGTVDTKVNLEHLFNAITIHPQLSELFKREHSLTHE